MPRLYISTQDSTICLILDSDLKFSRFQAVKKERLVNAFSKNICQTFNKHPLGLV